MPRLDQKGPEGQGAMTGRKAGRCTNFDAEKAVKGNADGSDKDENAPVTGGRGTGQGRGQGGRSGAGAGAGRGRGSGAGAGRGRGGGGAGR